MPLYENAVALTGADLETIQSGRKARAVAIGRLTQAELDSINKHRWEHNDEPHAIEAEVLFIGQHVYDSRIKGDNYTIDDVVQQIVSAMSEASAIVGNNFLATLFKIPFRESNGWGTRSTIAPFSSA
jgi:hypothetical protein